MKYLLFLSIYLFIMAKAIILSWPIIYLIFNIEFPPSNNESTIISKKWHIQFLPHSVWACGTQGQRLSRSDDIIDHTYTSNNEWEEAEIVQSYVRRSRFRSISSSSSYAVTLFGSSLTLFWLNPRLTVLSLTREARSCSSSEIVFSISLISSITSSMLLCSKKVATWSISVSSCWLEDSVELSLGLLTIFSCGVRSIWFCWEEKRGYLLTWVCQCDEIVSVGVLLTCL